MFRASEQQNVTPKDLPEEPSAHVSGEISRFHSRGDTVAIKDDPLAEAMRFLLDAQWASRRCHL
jgi:hypothetical protein